MAVGLSVVYGICASIWLMSSFVDLAKTKYRLEFDYDWIPTFFQRPLTVLCTALMAGNLPAIRAVQGDCERVYYLCAQGCCIWILLAGWDADLFVYFCILFLSLLFAPKTCYDDKYWVNWCNVKKIKKNTSAPFIVYQVIPYNHRFFLTWIILSRTVLLKKCDLIMLNKGW